FFSPGTLAKTRKAFDDMLSVAGEPQGVHPKLARILKRTFNDVEQVGGDLGKDKRRRTNPR
ncbi:hypothetical protein BT96DRAFT_795540, partial [Gymnopus androsaceus JB14]